VDRITGLLLETEVGDSLRNVAFIAIVLATGIRRLLPPD
jgi:hypothetical protein